MTITSARRTGLTMLAVATMLSASTVSAQGAGFKRCGTIAKTSAATNRYENVRARGVSCNTARQLPKQWAVNLGKNMSGCKSGSFCRVRTFTCKAAHPQDIDFLVDCRRSGARVLFTVTGPECSKTLSCPSSVPAGGRDGPV